MRGKDVVETARKVKKDFGPNCPKKFGGAASIEILRAALDEEGIGTSRRDVFIRGVPVELDLIVPRKDAKPWLELLFEPQQVAIALEVKKSGSFGEGTIDKIRADFAQLREVGVRSAYVTLEERGSYKWKATYENLGFPCFTLAWHKRTDGPLEPTEDWERLIGFLRKALAV
jgi:hypothetical protein